jgi:hypothetical protein
VNPCAFEPDFDAPAVNVAYDPTRFEHDPRHRKRGVGASALPRWGFALGVITQSLLNQAGPPELGYFATTSIEAVYECLTHNHALPDAQMRWQSD